jgi:hypothetical protein
MLPEWAELAEQAGPVEEKLPLGYNPYYGIMSYISFVLESLLSYLSLYILYPIFSG